LGRIGLKIAEIEDNSRPPNTMTVLSDLVDWMSERPSEAFAQLTDWKRLDLEEIQRRTGDDPSAKPRIEVSAAITKMRNFSVRWHPAGWKDAQFEWNASNASYFNLILRRKWSQKPDFRLFEGDESPTFDRRPSNELMYIRGVGNLRPHPRETYFGSYNRDILDSILICAVRAAYESLIRQLESSFEVKVIDAFDFETRDEIDESRHPSSGYPLKRVVKWTLEDANIVRARLEHKAAEDQVQRDRVEFANIHETYDFSIDVLIAALARATVKSAMGTVQSEEVICKAAAKDLRGAGFKIDAGQVRRIRRLVERFNPEVLPKTLVSAPQIVEARPTSVLDNVVPFPDKGE
jgi:hypothetical protein